MRTPVERKAGDPIFNEAVALGLGAALADLFLAHARLLGGSEDAILKTREVVDASLDGLKINLTSSNHTPEQVTALLRDRIGSFMDKGEKYARSKLLGPAAP